MNFPSFNISGHLPVGVHKASLTEVLQHFGMNTAKRRQIVQRLERIFKIASDTQMVARFIIFGSFITDKLAPNDVDVFMIMDDAFDASTLRGETQV